MPREQVDPDNRPPYLSLATLLNFVERLGEGPIPPRIDKSALETYSGATQTVLMSALKLVGWIDNDGRVLPMLREGATDVDRRKDWLKGWATLFYREQLDLARDNATSQMLQESFAASGYTGSTLRKAIVFYLALVEYLGLPNSPHFRAPKQSGTPTSRRRVRGSGTARSVPSERPGPVQQPSTGERLVVKIGDLATITVIVDAQWMRLPVETITSIRQAIDTLTNLGARE